MTLFAPKMSIRQIGLVIFTLIPTVSGGKYYNHKCQPSIGIQSVLCDNIGLVSSRNNNGNRISSSSSNHPTSGMDGEEEDSFVCFLNQSKRVFQSNTPKQQRETTPITIAAMMFGLRRSAVPFQRQRRQNHGICAAGGIEEEEEESRITVHQATRRVVSINNNNIIEQETRGALCAAIKKKDKNNTKHPSPHHHQDHRPLTFFETMVCGAVSRSIAQTTMHPANTMKTLLQKGGMTIRQVLAKSVTSPRLLFRGAGANFLLSIPHGAINFAMLEGIRSRLTVYTGHKGPSVDFASSCLATITCSIVSTPQMMICDNIMAGNYPNLLQAISGLAQQRGLTGFYTGWWPGLVGKIPSYALTWTFFQQLKRLRNHHFPQRPATDLENSAMGSMASALSVCLMIPIDTIKTRLVTQTAVTGGYTGIIDCAVKTFQKEGILAFYRGLPPRLVSVVPMIGIQFGVYEFMKKVMLKRQVQAVLEQEQRRQQQQELMEEDLAVEGSDVP